MSSLQTNQQNNFITTCITVAERTLDTLIGYGIAIKEVEIGRYSAPVIKVHYSAGCEKIKAKGFAQNPDSQRGVLMTRAVFNDCLVLWEEPYNTSLHIH